VCVETGGIGINLIKEKAVRVVFGLNDMEQVSVGFVADGGFGVG
jgi:hypothetical protein